MAETATRGVNVRFGVWLLHLALPLLGLWLLLARAGTGGKQQTTPTRSSATDVVV